MKMTEVHYILARSKNFKKLKCPPLSAIKITFLCVKLKTDVLEVHENKQIGREWRSVGE